MKIIGKVWKFLVLLIIILIVAAVLIPYIYEDKIKVALKESINEYVNAEVDFDDVSISLFKVFPNVAVNVSDLEVNGIKQFKGLQLFKASDIQLNADLSTIFNQEIPLRINSFKINDAKINIVIDLDGASNYNIYKSSPTDEENSKFQINLASYELTNTDISYVDKIGGTILKIEHLNHSGNGNFTSDVFDLNTETTVKSVNMSSGKMPYLSNVKLSGKNKIIVNNTKNTYTFQKNELRLNSLDLKVDGAVAMSDDMKINVKVKAPNASFGEFVSLLPSTYKNDIKSLNSKGKVDISGNIKGIYNADRNRVPAYDFDVKVKDGYLKFPQAPNPISDVNMDISIKSSSGDKMELSIPHMTFKAGENYLDGNLKYNSNRDNPKIKSQINAQLDLEDLNKSFPLEGIEQIQGEVDITDLIIDTDFKSVENEAYDQINFGGDVRMSGINVAMTDMPKIQMHEISFSADPEQIRIKPSRLQMGKTDISLDGKIENPLAYLVPSQSLKGNVKINSKTIDLNEWMSEEEESGQATPAQLSSELEKLTRNSGLKIDLQADKLIYGDYVLDHNSFKGSVTGEEINIESYNATLFDNDFDVSGDLNGVYDYVFNNEPIDGKLVFSSDKFDVNPFMESGEADAPVEIYRVPTNMNIDIKTKMKDVTYQNMEFEKMDGTISMKNGAILFNEVVSKTLGGSMNFEGQYDSTSEEPLFSLKYDMSKLSFKKTFESLSTVQQLAGLMKYIEGFFNSTLTMEAKLNDKMFPNLSTLNAQGFIETITGKIKEIGTLNEMSNQLGIKELKSLDISNTKNWFEVKDGTVGLKPETYKFGDIELELSGSHAYDSDMSYVIMAKIPRSKFDENQVSESLNSGLKFLEGKADKIGLDIGQGEFINLRIDLGGSLFKPLIDITPVGSEGRSLKQQVKDELTNKVNETKDTLVQIANEKVDKLKDTINTVIQSKTDTLTAKVKDKVNEQVDTLKNKAKDKVKEQLDTMVTDIIGDKIDTLINDKVDTLIQGQLDNILGDKKNEQVDKVKDKIKDWNPFKKKGG